jgi:hypothetical protein
MKKQAQEQTYQTIRGYVVDAQRQVRMAVNSAMVEAYWHIGEAIFKECGDNDRAAYGKQASVAVHLGATVGGVRSWFQCPRIAQYAPVLSDVSKTLHTVERIELVALSSADANSGQRNTRVLRE